VATKEKPAVIAERRTYPATEALAAAALAPG